MGTTGTEHGRQQRGARKKELQRLQARTRYTLSATTRGEVCSSWVDVPEASEGVAGDAAGLGPPSEAAQSVEQFGNAYYSRATRCTSFRPRTASKVMVVMSPGTPALINEARVQNHLALGGDSA